MLAIMDVNSSNSSDSQSSVFFNPIARAVNYNQNRLFLVMELLLSLPQGEAFFALNDLHSLIDLKVGLDSYSAHLEVQFHHKSFQDFLITRERSQGFYVDLQSLHGDVAHSCLNFLTRYRYEVPEEYVVWLYAFFRLRDHINRSSNFFEIPDFFQPLNAFFSATQQCSDYLDLQRAIKILSMNAQAIIGFTEALMNNQSPSVGLLKSMNGLWLQFDGIHRNIDLHPFRTSIIFPLWLKHLKSYNNDVLVKRLLAIRVIFPLKWLDQSYLYMMMETTYNQKSFGEMLFNIDTLYGKPHQKDLSILLSASLFSGGFHCASNDYSNAYITILCILMLSPNCFTDLKMWAKSLLDRNQGATPALLAALESAARAFHDKDYMNRFLTHKTEVYLLGWLKKLSDPPKSIIDAWQKTFSKARVVAEKNYPGNLEYFCYDKDSCPTCPDWSTTRRIR
ncbi:hypothetical protein BDQ17DRAFT_1538081 [Cyathus striatus]|nr:hypothetical protein BDQ17DRAFT_1538081 [Cyathus striatus]